ncbi:MAG: hypothetical protein M1832_006315 [Thelocarpon impressellum]|nr:MAG: hypothetical protein M1832_006315 [Thelocarpon impressellum]
MASSGRPSRVLSMFSHSLGVRLQRAVAPSAASPPVISVAPGRSGEGRWSKRIVNIPNVVILAWLILLWWGERRVFASSVEDCHWKKWERWPPGATPHHLVLLADPQLVDPHTYPDRPWPLSALTFRHTDLYLRRAYSTLQASFDPDTILFLGDLFDGGREWRTARSQSPEQRWRKYGEDFWLREYDRFGKIFFGMLGRGRAGAGQRGKKVIASLPGNHDVGLGLGIQLPVRERFNAYFGDGSRVDVIANHTFVSVDTVSLSAKGQDGDGEKIWRPVQDFLNGVQAQKRRATSREMQYQRGETEGVKWPHAFLDLNRTLPKPERPEGPDFPTVLLTHVPLYRPAGTRCGPLREHWPPSGPEEAKDERNGIPLRAGYQYQNVLTSEISTELLEKVGNVAHVFSGDDHDYCEVVHKSYTTSAEATGAAGIGGVKEITVKSMSWAMGVRKPGFLMLSLWNPVDGDGRPMGSRTGHGPVDATPAITIESHLCLLPDQLAIFIRYATLFGLTLVTLVLRAVLLALARPTASDAPLLPMYGASEKRHSPQSSSSSDSSQGSSSLHPSARSLAARHVSSRARSASPSYGYGIPAEQAAEPLVAHATSPRSEDSPRLKRGAGTRVQRVGVVRRTADEAGRSMAYVGGVGGVWYLWLVWTG